MDDDLFLPAKDECASLYCRLPESAHVGWEDGGPHHAFLSPNPLPRPERRAVASIETQWECTHCGELCIVEGVADCEWMECSGCSHMSYVAS